MTVADLYRALWRYRFMIIALTAGTVALTWFVSAQQTKEYTASAIVRVQQRVADQSEVFGALQTGERLARTYAVIAGTNSIATEIRIKLGPTLGRGPIDVRASQLDNLELLRVSATDPNPVRAARIANAVPAALVSFNQKNGTLRDQIVSVERAVSPRSPSSPRLGLNLVLALVVGLILNASLALLVGALSDRVGDVEQIEREFGYPVVATVPSLKFAKPSRSLARTRPEPTLVPLSKTDVGG